MTLSASRIQTLLEPYHPATPLQVCDKIVTYIDLLTFWGRKIALTAISTEEEIARFHFGESIFALSLQSFEKGRLADVGSGAGFPGLAIKLLRANLKLTLLEPNKRKCAFLNEVIRKLELREVEVLPIGFQQASESKSGDLMYVTSRALGRTSDLLSWSRNALSVDGRVVLWLGANDVVAAMKVPNWHWAQAAIPESARRKILVGIPGNVGIKAVS
ncbi:MAG: 16S rRNA (guanine(527)-N(7))-methyltransferase RsmG [Candidatus Dormibacteria bacterium]